jgi:hypothetical protein
MWIVWLAPRRPYTFVVAAMLIAVPGLLCIATMPTDIFKYGRADQRPRHRRRADLLANQLASGRVRQSAASVRLIKTYGGGWEGLG